MRPLWRDERIHHHFRMVEKESSEVLQDAIEIHTVELAKYNTELGVVSQSNVLEQWCYWIKYSHEHTEEELRVLLPGLPFLHATHELNEIREVTEEKHMYDSREKAALDLQSGLIDAKEEGREEGLEEGLEKGREEGLEKGEIKLIRTLQEILGEPVSAESDLANHELEQLQSIAAELRDRILRRS